MNRSRFLVIASVLGLVFGLAFLLAPAQLMSLYNISLDAAGQWIGRFLGAQLVGLAIITWRARNAPAGSALSAVMIGNLIGASIALILAILEGLSGIGNAMVWSIAVIYAFLAAGFGYFQFAKAQKPSQDGSEAERRVA
jgi:hypothetical protein